MEASNVMAIREALAKADAAFNLIVKSAWFIEANFHETKEVMDASNAITATLSAPPRNCDVGTAEEQQARFDRFCDKYKNCTECPVWRGGELTSRCSMYWAQLPYEKGETK